MVCPPENSFAPLNYASMIKFVVNMIIDFIASIYTIYDMIKVPAPLYF